MTYSLKLQNSDCVCSSGIVMINEYFGELCSGSVASLYPIKLIHTSDFHPHKVYQKDEAYEVHNDV